MSQVPAEVDAGQLEPDPSAAQRPGATYLTVLRKPGALRFSLAGAIGRTPMAMFGLGTVMLISASTGRYALAGLVSGAGSIGYAISAPQIARLADTFGQRRVLRPLIAVFAIGCAAFVACAELRAPVWVLIITGCVAGSSMPSLGSMVRSRWSALLHNAAELHAAFSLESVVDEMVFVVGPPLVTLLATLLPPAGILVCAVLSVTGTLVFAAQRRTEPPAQGRLRATDDRAAEPSARRRWLPAPGLSTMVPLYYCLGAMFASFDLSTVDFAQRAGHKPLAGLILGTYALGSGIGGLWYGTRHWHAPLHRRFALTLILTVAGVATFWAQPNLVSLDAGVLVAGLTIAPTLIAGYGLTEQQAPAARRTEAMTWLSSSIAVGVATGSSVCGRIIDTAGPRWGYAFAACCGGVAVATCLLGLRRLAATTEADAAQWVDA
jgi:MFS family permease